MIKYPPNENRILSISQLFSRKAVLLIKKITPYIKTFFQRADMFLFSVCLICACMSVYAVHVTTVGLAAQNYAGINPTKMVIVQIFSLFLGIVAYVLFTVIDADILGRQWKALCVAIVLLLVALTFFGSDDGTGNKSWIRFGPIGIQPSEVIKVLYIILSAKLMSYLKEHKDINAFPSVVAMAGLFFIIFALIMVVSSDLGNAIILFAIFLVMFFFLGVRLYWFALGGAAIAAMIPLLWNFLLKDYQKKRLIAPYNPSVDPSGYGITWQTRQSQLTLASGRLTGVEEGHTATAFTGKHTDFIFASIGEHWGMIGCLIVIALLVIIIVHCFRVGIHSGRTFDMLLCVGVGTAIAFQTFINIGMCIGITPVIGITLPFFSYGGSSIVSLFAAMGIVSGIKYKRKPTRYAFY